MGKINGVSIVNNFYCNGTCIIFSGRGVLAEGANFFMVSSDFEAEKLTGPGGSGGGGGVPDLSFYTLTPRTSDQYVQLARRLGRCSFRDVSRLFPSQTNLILSFIASIKD